MRLPLAVIVLVLVASAGCLDALRDRFDGSSPHIDSLLAQEPGVVEVREQGGGFVASLRATASGPAANVVKSDVSAFNGAIRVAPSSDGNVTVDVLAWAKGSTEAEARERLEAIRLNADVSGDRVTGTATAPRGENQNRGAHVVLAVPDAAILEGQLKTSNGRVSVDGVPLRALAATSSNGAIELKVQRLEDVTAKTSNGRIVAEGSAAGSLDLTTSNGRIEGLLTPTAPVELTAKTSNGRIELALAESAAIGYKLSASTSNGRITEDMDEASYEGSRTSGALETPGHAQRPLKVTGTVATSNGNIAFASA